MQTTRRHIAHPVGRQGSATWLPAVASAPQLARAMREAFAKAVSNP